MFYMAWRHRVLSIFEIYKAHTNNNISHQFDRLVQINNYSVRCYSIQAEQTIRPDRIHKQHCSNHLRILCFLLPDGFF